METFPNGGLFEPIERRKAALAKLLRHAKAGLLLNEHIEYDDGEMVFHHACKLGLEGIVSKRLSSPYRSGRSRHWIKSKNAKHPGATAGSFAGEKP